MKNKIDNNLETENLIETKGFKPGEKVFSVDQMRIAVMPHKFSKKANAHGNTKSIGIFIVILGAIFLITISASAYWYFSQYEQDKKQEEKSVLNILDNDPQDPIKTEVLKEESQKSTKKIPEQEKKNIVEEKIIEDLEHLKEPKEASSSQKKNIVKIVATTSEEKIVKEEIKNYKKALDSDLDGLFDPEENLLACSSILKDSDGDGYDDLSEFLKLYNPTGAGSLMVNPNIEEYRNGDYNYKVYYPKTWKPLRASEGESLIFNISSNNFIQIIVQENKEGINLETWFKKQFDTPVISSSQIIYKRGWVGYKSEDGLNIYLNRPGRNEIYSLSYSLPPGTTLNYQNIFQMMINSFELI